VRHDHPKVSGRELSHIPGKRGLPVLGILPEAVLDPLAFARRMYDRYGPVHRFYACGNWNVQLVGPEANEFVLFDQQGNFSAEGGWRPVFGRHFDGGLLLRDGADHQWHRKLIASAFKQEQLKAYAALFARNAAEIARKESGRTFDTYELAQRFAFANGFSAFLGRDPAKATRKDLLSFRHLMKSASAVITTPLPGSAEGRAAAASRHVARLARSLREEPIAPERADLFATLQRLRTTELLEDDEVLAHFKFIVAASFDTLSSGIVAVLYHLAANPEWQTRLRDEISLAVPQSNTCSAEALNGCEQLGWAIKEALRLNSGAPVLWRRAIKDYTFAGHHFPRGTITGVNPMLTHLLPSIWHEPSTFDPARFRPEEERLRPRGSFIPFGAGVHGCLGARYAYMQLRSMLAALLAKHELALVSPRPVRWHHWPNCQPRGKLLLELRRL
jgi:cytochrome P450